MSDLALLRTMADYNRWANGELFDAVRALPDGEAAKTRPGLFSSIVNTLNHPLVTDRIWMAHLAGTRHGHTALNEIVHSDLEPLEIARREMDLAIVDMVASLTRESAQGAVDFTLLSGETGTMSRAMIVMHMINHNTYHRGFVVETFCQIPAPLPLIDLPVFMRGTTGLTTSPPHLKPVRWEAAD